MNSSAETHREGPLTEGLENYTAKIPSSVYLAGAVAAMATSLTLKCMGRKHTALFIGQWAAPFLLLGIYNKLVKQSGHDEDDNKGTGF